MWLYHLGPQWTKRLLLTGDSISGTEAARLGFALESVPPDQLDEHVDALAARLAMIDHELLAAQKRQINLALELMGARTMQRVAAEIDARGHLAPAAAEFRQIGKEQDSRPRWSGATPSSATAAARPRTSAAAARRPGAEVAAAADRTDLAGRTALVIGAQRPLGRAIAVALAEAGVDVAVGGVSAAPHEDFLVHSVANELWAMDRRSIAVPIGRARSDLRGGGGPAGR